jgi:phage-related protein
VDKGTKDLGETLEHSTKNFRGGADAVDGMSAVMGSLGVNLPGPIGGIISMSRGFADLADGIGTTVLPAVEKVLGKMGIMTAASEAQTVATEEGTVAQEGLNTALLANPIGIIIAAAAALAVGFYELWQHSETFRNGVKALGADAVKVFHGITAVAADVGKAISEPFILAFDGIRAAWNDTIGRFGIHVHLPSWLGGEGFDFDMPKMANGGRPTGPTLVGERGPEMFVPDGPGSIVPLRGGQNSTGSGTHLTVDFSGVSNDALVNALRQGVRARGGNAQVVLGVAR